MTTTLPTQDQVDRVAEFLAPDVIRVRLDITTDWAGFPAMYFRVIVADESSSGDQFYEVARQVEARFNQEMEPIFLEYLPIFKYRSKSEQAAIKERAWD